MTFFSIFRNPDAGEALSFTCEILKYASSRTSSSLIPARTKTRSGLLYRRSVQLPNRCQRRIFKSLSIVGSL